MSEFGYIPEAPEQSFGNNKGIFKPKDIYDLTRADKYTNYGQLELIETKTGSGVSAIDFTAIKETEYNVHLLTINDFNVTTDGQPTGIRLSNGSFISSGYQWANQTGRAGGSFAENRSTSSTYLEIGRLNGNTTNEKLNGYVYFYNLGDSSKYSFLTHQTTYTNEFSAEYMMSFGSGVRPTADTVSGIRLTSTSGNITVTSASLYGIKEYS